MAVYGSNTGFGPPKTVTFNPVPQDEAQFRSARLGGRAIAGTLGVASALLALVALVMALNMISALAATWSELLTLGLIATGVVAALVGLPIASALMQRAYPVEARRAVVFWLAAMLVVSLAATFVAWRLAAPGARDAAVKLHAAPLCPPAVRSSFMTSEIWRGTDGCRRMRSLYDGMACEEYAHRKSVTGTVEPPREMVAEAPAGDWSPSGVLGVAGVGDGYLRRLAVLFLNLFAVAGAGIIGRWSVLATAETYRLGISEASALPSMSQMPAAPASSAGPVVMQQDAFSMWASGRLIQESGASVRADALLADFQETCRLNNLPLQTSNWFFNKMADLARSSGGRIVKYKSDTMHFRGVRLPSSGDINAGVANGGNQWVN